MIIIINVFFKDLSDSNNLPTTGVILEHSDKNITLQDSKSNGEVH